MTMEKLTKRDYFNRILAYAHDEDKDFLKHEIELLEKKNASRSTKPTKAQAENANLAEKVLASIETGKAYTISEIQKTVPALTDLSNQRVTAIVRSLVRMGTVTRSEVKGKAYFTKI